MRKLLIAMALVAAVALGVATWAHLGARSADQARDRSLQQADDLQRRVRELRIELSAIEANGRDDAAAAAAARDALAGVVRGGARVETRLRAALVASRALSDAQAELTTVTNRVVDLLNAGDRDRAGALLEGEARRRETEVQRARAAQDRAAVALRRAVATYREAAR